MHILKIDAAAVKVIWNIFYQEKTPNAAGASPSQVARFLVPDFADPTQIYFMGTSSNRATMIKLLRNNGQINFQL
jgi:hypothetical protein